jgi:hypothetical protein
MSPEDQDAIIGSVLRQRKDAQQKLAMLHAEAKRMGQKLETLSGMLMRNPHDVWFDAPQPVNSFKSADVDARKISDLTGQIRDTYDEVKKWNDEAKKLGFGEG